MRSRIPARVAFGLALVPVVATLLIGILTKLARDAERRRVEVVHNHSRLAEKHKGFQELLLQRAREESVSRRIALEKESGYHGEWAQHHEQQAQEIRQRYGLE